MKVGLYFANISIKGGGIYTYANALLKLLINENSISKILILYSPDQKEYINKLKAANSKILPLEINIEKSVLKRTFLNLSKLFWLNRVISKNRLPGFMDKISQFLNPYYHLFNRLEVDLIHIPVQVSPAYCVNKPVIVTLHDLQDIHFPEFFTPEHRLERSIHLYRAAKLADKIIVSFNHIKADIVNFFNINENKVAVVPLPLTRYWQNKVESFSEEEILSKFRIKGEYILYPAITWRHKNHITLFKALKNLKDQGKQIQLICTGELHPYYDVLINEITKSQLQESVKFLGVVAEEELVSLYKFAKLIVIPSLYEAGSGPLIEAIWLGLPVICSNVTSLPETIGDDRFTFNPLDAEKLAELILKMLNDKKFFEENINNSQRRREEFGKIDINNHLINMYSELLVRWKENN